LKAIKLTGLISGLIAVTRQISHESEL